MLAEIFRRLSIMNGLKNRGVEDILIACVDDLNGFPQAIETVYLKTESVYEKISVNKILL